jgi:hypothetical protein
MWRMSRSGTLIFIAAVVAREHREEQRFIVRSSELARWIRGKGHLGKSVAQSS